MKKLVLMGVFTMMVALSSFAHKGEEVNENVLRAFNKEFADAQDVNWEVGKTVLKATFRLNGQVLFAYYQETGNLVAVTRNIISGQLPISLLADLKKNYQEYWITDLFEISADDSTDYYITLQNPDQTIILKSSGVQGWQTFRKQKAS
ncbi:hypothetical protein [Pseudoflavitalea rhizosphaerae]|uniref:hypothetical protein n=1 Tax=Pseudoflavitalea rhizosphaerae TaxID=1884793 RepID=UPI000F8D5D1E|nr:hypothetical protein [Pseudoflavitalea rhizosphaerae]